MGTLKHKRTGKVYEIIGYATNEDTGQVHTLEARCGHQQLRIFLKNQTNKQYFNKQYEAEGTIANLLTDLF